jgi:ubiquinone/menaquinone biosynthesis C-methylase UbiE
MKLNTFEKLLMVNPLRPLLLRHFEARRLLKMGGEVGGGTALEVGCGSGHALDVIRTTFKVDRLHAFDLDLEMVRRTTHRQHRSREPSALWVGNARALPIASDSYDAVFTFGAIHHIVDWRAALDEIYRVLKPGGRFYAEEILAKYIIHPLWGRLMDHPQEDRFDFEAFGAALSAAGFRVADRRQFMELHAWYIADKPATARPPASDTQAL